MPHLSTMKNVSNFVMCESWKCKCKISMNMLKWIKRQNISSDDNLTLNAFVRLKQVPISASDKQNFAGISTHRRLIRARTMRGKIYIAIRDVCWMWGVSAKWQISKPLCLLPGLMKPNCFSHSSRWSINENSLAFKRNYFFGDSDTRCRNERAVLNVPIKNSRWNVRVALLVDNHNHIIYVRNIH